MAPSAKLISAFLACFCILSAVSPAIGDQSLTVYDVLRQYGFPVGLLPKGVTSYELDSSTGKFSVYLNGSCSFTIDGYQLKYKSTITGTISEGKLSDLSGVQVKILFFWVNIIEVSNEGDEIDFSVGIASASFTIDNFYESPQCGCGFDCVNGGKLGIAPVTKVNPKRLVSSS